MFGENEIYVHWKSPSATVMNMFWRLGNLTVYNGTDSTSSQGRIPLTEWCPARCQWSRDLLPVTAWLLPCKPLLCMGVTRLYLVTDANETKGGRGVGVWGVGGGLVCGWVEPRGDGVTQFATRMGETINSKGRKSGHTASQDHTPCQWVFGTTSTDTTYLEQVHETSCGSDAKKRFHYVATYIICTTFVPAA